MRCEKTAGNETLLQNQLWNPLFELLSVNRLGGIRILAYGLIVRLTPPLPYNSNLGTYGEQISAGN